MLIMLAESRFLRRKLVRHPVDAGPVTARRFLPYVDHLTAIHESEHFQTSIGVGTNNDLLPIDRTNIGPLAPALSFLLDVVDASIVAQLKKLKHPIRVPTNSKLVIFKSARPSGTAYCRPE